LLLQIVEFRALLRRDRLNLKRSGLTTFANFPQTNVPDQTFQQVSSLIVPFVKCFGAQLILNMQSVCGKSGFTAPAVLRKNVFLIAAVPVTSSANSDEQGAIAFTSIKPPMQEDFRWAVYSLTKP
jgi:hypothetical protein